MNKKKFDTNKIYRLKTDSKLTVKTEKGDGGAMIIEAYVSIFGNVDLAGDIIQKGAFAESIAKKLPAGVWFHIWDKVIASTLEAREDDKGLYIKGQFIEGVQQAEEAYKIIKSGAVTEFSIGFKVLDYEWDEADNFIIKKVKLYEWSPVLAGCNPDTELISIDKIKADALECREEKNKKIEKKKTIKGLDVKKIKVDYINVDTKKQRAKINYRDEKGIKREMRIKLSGKCIKHIKSVSDTKVKNQEGGTAKHKILLIEREAKKSIKLQHKVLRILRD